MKTLRAVSLALFFTISTLGVIVTIQLFKKDYDSPPLENKSAPHFTAQTVSGKQFDLQQASDTTIVYIGFLRFSSCPVCNFRVHELIGKMDEFKNKGILPIIVFESSREDLEKYADFYKIPFEMIPDLDKELYDLYEVEENIIKLTINSTGDEVDELFEVGEDLFYDDAPMAPKGNQSRLPADFVISKGKFIKTNYGRHIGDSMPIENILAAAGN